jgi:HlyD family secretion protein
MRMRTAAVVGLALAAGFTAAACSSSGASGDVTPVVAVQEAAAERGPLQQWVRQQAVLYPLRQTVITPKVSAPVKRYLVQLGDPVHAGELLAVLDHADLKAALEAAQGRLQAAQAAYDTAVGGAIPAALKTAQLNLTATAKALANARTVYANRQRLFEQGAIPRLTLQQAGVALVNAQNAHTLAQQQLQALEAGGGHAAALRAAEGNLMIAKADAAAAAAQLNYTEIRSPINGVVTARPLYPGQLATTSQPLITVMDLSHVVARLHVPAGEAALLKVGDRARIRPQSGGTPVAGKVTVVNAATDPGSTTVEVWVEAPNPGEALRPGTTVQAAVLARTIPDALTVPAAALLTDSSGATTVMLAGADGKAHQQAVTVGVKEPNRVQIVKGLNPGQKVVTVGAYGLDDGTRIQIVANADGAAAS